VSRKRHRGPKPGTPQAPEATPPPSAASVPGDKSRAARRAAERARRKAVNVAARGVDRDAASSGDDGHAAVEPVFFFGFAVARAKLAVARFWIFGLLAVDAFLQLRHAPRYGAGGFNVGQLPIFDHAAPARVAVGVVQIMLVYLFGAIALGVGSRLTVAVAAALYGWVYFSSQLDGYQHHYLMVLVLALSIAVPWFRPRDMPRTEGARPVRTWAMRVILIQLGIVYLWAAIAKFDGSWLDGSALAAQLDHGRVYALIDATVGFAWAARLVLAAELFLAIAVWVRPLWPFALPLGVGLHVGIAFTNLEIGLFSWLMVALYLLVIPERWFVAVWRRLNPGLWIDRVDARLSATPAVGVALAIGSLVLPPIVVGVPIERAMIAAVGGGLLVITADAIRSRRLAPRPAVGLALGAVAIGLAILTAKTTVMLDYYKFWGGASRRLGDPDAARYAYGRAAELAPDEPGNHYQLGRLLLDQGPAHDDARGLVELHRAQALEPHRARAFLAEARFLASAGRSAEAVAAARAAAEAEPGNADARALAAALSRGDVERPEPAPSPGGDDEPTP